MLETWLATVRGLITSDLAIVWLASPLARWPSTSSSRSVSIGKGRSATGAGCWWTSRSTIRESKTAPPAATVRMACGSWSVVEALRMYPDALASIAAARLASSSTIDSTSTTTSGCRSSTSRVAVIPSMPAMLTSMTTTSGRVASTTASNASPSAASPTSSRSSRESSSVAMPVRINAWSSATTTRIVAGSPISSPAPGTRRSPRRHRWRCRTGRRGARCGAASSRRPHRG